MIKRWEKDKRSVDLYFPIPSHIAKALHSPRPTVTIECKRFSKSKSDLMEKTYKVGSDMNTISFPPYAVSAIALANVSLQVLIKDHFDYYLDVLTYDSQEPITRITLSKARRHKQVGHLSSSCSHMSNEPVRDAAGGT